MFGYLGDVTHKEGAIYKYTNGKVNTLVSEIMKTIHQELAKRRVIIKLCELILQICSFMKVIGTTNYVVVR
jgi:hypothetical protein